MKTELDLQGFHGAAREALLQRIAAVIHEERQKLMEKAMPKHPGKAKDTIPLDPQGAKSSNSNDRLDRHRGMKKGQPRKFG